MASTKNEDIKRAIKKARVKYYEVAQKLGINASWFSHKLEAEVTPEFRQKVFEAIEKVVEDYEA